MIEAKEGCEIIGQRRTLSQITYQRFFGRYLLLARMTGTAKEVEPELKRVSTASSSAARHGKVIQARPRPSFVSTTSCSEGTRPG
jgi:preprotein translocase subunit SecA